MKASTGRTALREPLPPRVNGSLAAGVPAARLPLVTRQRKPGYVALGVLLIVGLAALGGYLYITAGQKTPVVVVVNQVPAGHVVAAGDLSTIDVAGGVVAIAGPDLSTVVGETATIDLLPDMVLQRSMLTAEPALGVDQAQVGVALRVGQMPADGLLPGDTVQVLQLPAKDTAAAAGAPAAAAVVLQQSVPVFSAVPDPSQAGGAVVTLTVPTAGAAAIAAAGGQGLVALVKVRS
jgi:hypothetical protein